MRHPSKRYSVEGYTPKINPNAAERQGKFKMGGWPKPKMPRKPVVQNNPKKVLKEYDLGMPKRDEPMEWPEFEHITSLEFTKGAIRDEQADLPIHQRQTERG